jgi:aspartate 1-decarboxylase
MTTSQDENLIEVAGLVAGEKVHVLNVNNGNRLETCMIRANRGLTSCA